MAMHHWTLLNMLRHTSSCGGGITLMVTALYQVYSYMYTLYLVYEYMDLVPY